MRTEINKKRARPSERSEEARAKGAKRGKTAGGSGPLPTPQKIFFNLELKKMLFVVCILVFQAHLSQ